ncbi:MAG: AMP-binding protein, partial [Candidatus Pacebacteria bacterium]|nr:AMP-binding protein [Candidatus Paceibacterota bacterium]
VVLAFFLGASSGLFLVPLNAFIQDRSPREIRGQVLACSSFLSFTGVAISAALIRVLSGVFDFDPSQSFLVVAALTAALVVGTLVIIPDFFVRFLVVLLTRTVYRIKTHGIENVPIEGGALLVPNHVSWVDALLLSATTQRRVRFIMARNIAGWWLFRPLFRLMKVIPISPNDPPRKVVAALNEARQALDDGSLVCIFAEGTITRSGNLNAFKSGFERILKGSSCPVVPVYLGGVWGSVFSYYSGRICSSLPRRVPYPVDVLFGEPLPPSSSSAEVERAVGALSCDWFDLRKGPRRTLGQQFVSSARRHWFHPAMCDTTGKRLRYGAALTAAVALSRRVDKVTQGEQKIGVLLPASVGGALANVALTLLGKVPVNLNFTASREAFASAIQQCEIRTILTSRAFLSRLEGVDVPQGLVYVEDLASQIGPGQKVCALFAAMFSPARRLGGGRSAGPDDVATIIFSSGSTAEPKGVMLTHHNILSNVESIAILFRFAPGDSMCCVLPPFHSFGFTVTLWSPLITGILAGFHSDPLDGEAVAKLVQKEKLSFLASTPTFLMAYVRRATREEFASLTSVYVGGEKLTTRVADAFEKCFGIRPLEGYGTTELSPVAAFNVADVERGPMRWIGSREGSIGRPLPGVLMKVVEEETGAEVAAGVEGLLMVKGANVMAGYLGREDLTRAALDAGWYRTGDIARIDSDGFVFILDRQSRFSKIGGEMVPHVAVEDVLAGDRDASHPVVVTGVPDPKKGEQLVVLYTDEAGDVDGLHGAIKQSDLPNLWRPKERNYFHVDRIPVLGSGKLDLKKIRIVAREFSEGRPGLLKSALHKLRESL